MPRDKAQYSKTPPFASHPKHRKNPASSCTWQLGVRSWWNGQQHLYVSPRTRFNTCPSRSKRPRIEVQFLTLSTSAGSIMMHLQNQVHALDAFTTASPA